MKNVQEGMVPSTSDQAQQRLAQTETATVTRTILVIDDDPAILEMLAWTLEDAGYTVAAVTSGREALQWIRAAAAVGEPPALILLDLALPGMNGQQIVAALREQWGAKVWPIIVISADYQAELRGRELGAAFTLRKPFRLEGLLEAVRQFAA